MSIARVRHGYDLNAVPSLKSIGVSDENGQVIPDGSRGSCSRKREAHECWREEAVYGDCGQTGLILFPESF